MVYDADRSQRAPAWQAVPDEKWDDWRWQLSNRLNTAEELGQVIDLRDEEIQALEAEHLFRVDITPYFASLIRPGDFHDPIRRQVIPTVQELRPFTSMMEDSLAEDMHSPVPGLVHRYPDRVLMLVTTQCASYCRYCTRSRIVGDPSAQFSRTEYEEQLAYIERTPQIRDVLLSGGDPLTLPPKVLENLLASLRAIEHVEVVRIGTRVPVFLPQRVTDELCAMLHNYHPLWMNIHVNHPQEITPELSRACAMLADAGIPLGNQSVLLAGVNDCVHLQRALCQELVKLRVRPYYLYQCDLVEGAGHFRTPVAKGIEIIEGLRGHTSGFAVPQYIIDAPGGGGKVPLMPNYLLSQSEDTLVLRNFEGFITTYEQPLDYKPHDPKQCVFCQQKRPEPGQAGLTGLLDRHALFIKPEGFDQVRSRGGAAHRLRGDDSSKWQAAGIEAASE
jgi:lysine 2,3-aminomutase